jgi:tyrosine-protein kinase Etk/Wzc
MNQPAQDPRTAYPAPEYEDDEIDLADLVGMLLDNRWLILSVTAMVFLVGLAYVLIATPIYRADALIQVEEKKSGIGDLDINAIFEGDTSVTAEIEILRSRMVLGTVVNNLKLDIVAAPNFFPVVGKALARRTPEEERKSIRVNSLDVGPGLIGEPLKLVVTSSSGYQVFDADDQLLINGVVGEAVTASISGEPAMIFVSELRGDDGDEFYLERQSRLKAIESLEASLGIAEIGKLSGILSISVQGEHPGEIARQVDEIADVYVRQNVERKSAEAEKTLSFLDEQLPLLKQDMEAAEAALNSYRREKGSVDLPLETQAVLETIITVEGQLNELRQERDKVTQGYTSAQPMVIALDRQLERLTGELNKLNNQVRDLPETQQEILRLVRDAEVTTALYMSLLNAAQELRVVKAGTVGNVRVVDHAVVPYEPIKPKTKLILLLSTLLGIFSGVILAVLKHAIRGGVEDPNVIEKQLGLPVYATIAHSKNQDRIFKRLQSKEAKRAILATKHPEDISIESLRNLGTALHFGTMDAKNNCIMIAGPSPSVGKSFVSVNLAAVLASNSKKVSHLSALILLQFWRAIARKSC